MLCIETKENFGHSYCTDIDIFVQKSREAFLDGATVDQEKWPIMSCCCHHDPWHILVAPWNRDIGIVVLSLSVIEKGIRDDAPYLGACYGFNLEKVSHCPSERVLERGESLLKSSSTLQLLTAVCNDLPSLQ